MTELIDLSIAELRDGLKTKQFKAVELVEHYLREIEQSSRLNAYVCVTADKAMEMAAQSDARIASGDTGDLEGIPIGVKDLFATRGVRTQACSRILQGFKPEYESRVTENLWNAGAVMLGKLNMDEFAMGSSNETGCDGHAVNPWKAVGSDAELVPGGSSGGSAAAVAARLCAASLGTDTGGSIRQPAAFTATVGLKPTYGRCSRWGMVAFASSLDQAGPITRTVRDSAIMLRAMASFDERDSTSSDQPVPDYESLLGKGVQGLKIGIPKEYRMEGMPADIEAAWQQGMDCLRQAGAEIVDISLPHTEYALPAYYIVSSAEASSNLARYDGVRYGLRAADSSEGIDGMYMRTRNEGFGDEVKRRILVGTYVLSAGYYDAYYLKAQKVRALIRQDFEDAFNAGIDAILTPTTPNAAFPLGEELDPVDMYMNDVMTVPVNMAGLPALSVPCGLNPAGLPLGLQLIGKWFDEPTLFSVGQVIEDAVGNFTPDKWW